jgi:hypothetical protein
LVFVCTQLLAHEPQVRVEIQEDVYQYTAADNGAGPMWCSGSTCLARIGDDIFASGLETLPDQKPLNNCRWLLYRRQTSGWQLLQSDPDGRTREPCPLAAFHGGPLFLSANPTLTPPDAASGPARPEILQFDPRQPATPFERILPQWNGGPAFSEHSYRSFAADGAERELLLMQNVNYTHAEWSFRDQEGNWSAGKLDWPWGAEYDKPQPIRVCYPDVALTRRAVYLCGVSDIHEPYEAWRKYKKELTGQDWDYDFRRLFFTWSDDITTGKFHAWVEISSRDKTAGWIMPGDLWVGPDGRVHVLWTERAIDERLRPKFFPDAKQSQTLNYAVIHQGAVLSRQSLVMSEEGRPGLTGSAPRFHATTDGRLFVMHYVSGSDEKGRSVSENRLLEIHSDGSLSAPVVVPLSPPFTSYFTATVRAGNSPSDILDLLGTRAGHDRTISYARIRVE